MPAYYQRLLDAAGIPPAGAGYELPVSPGDREEVRRRLDRLGRHLDLPLVGLSPGARYGASKLWEPARFAALARRLRDEVRAEVVLLCGPGEEALAARIAAEAGPPLLDTSQDPVPLRLLAAFCDELAVLVSTDSGPRHIAVARSRPVVVVMGPTHPAWTAWNLEHTTVLRHDVPCGPCHLRECPTDHRCMDLITVDEVFRAVTAALSD